MAVRFRLFDRWGRMIGEVQCERAQHRQEVGGEDTLEIATGAILSPGDRILWDDDGVWREHVVNGIQQEHGSTKEISYVCESSLIWDLGHRCIQLADMKNKDTPYMVDHLLENVPLWEPGEVEALGSKDIAFEKCTTYEALVKLADEYGCEFEPVIEVGETGVTSRRVNVKAQVGRDTAYRFDFKYGLEGVRKQVHEDYVITACYGIGSTYSKQSARGYYWCYVTDEEALQYWGIPDGEGGLVHAEGIYEAGDLQGDALTQATIEYLGTCSAPSITYEVDIPGASAKGVRCGDTITVVDRDFDPELRLNARVNEMTRDLITGMCEEAVFGTYRSLVPEVMSRSWRQSREALEKANAATATPEPEPEEPEEPDEGEETLDGGRLVVRYGVAVEGEKGGPVCL